MTLFVVYSTDTGNVVGAVNAIGGVPPAGDTDVGALVGKELPLRVSLDTGKVATLAMPAGKLAFHTPDDEPAVLTDPLAFGVEQVPDQKPKPALVALNPWNTELKFDDTGLMVHLPMPDQTHDLAVLALISAGQDTVPRQGTIKAGGQDVTLPVTVDPGPHGVLVLVTGWAGRLESVTK